MRFDLGVGASTLIGNNRVFLASAWYESFAPGLNLSISARASCIGMVALSYSRFKNGTDCGGVRIA
jgi:hypothetical protein